MKNKLGYKVSINIIDATHLLMVVKIIGMSTRSFELTYPEGSDIDSVCRVAFPEAFVEAGLLS